MRSKMIAMLASVMLITGCQSTDVQDHDETQSDSQSQSTSPAEPDYSQCSLTLAGKMIDSQVNDQTAARAAIANTGNILKIGDVNSELGDCKEFDFDSIHTYRFARSHDGIPVFGSSVTVCTGNNGEVLQISGRPIDFDGISSEPKTNIEEIISVFRSAYNLDENALILNRGLVFYINKQNQPVLSYRLVSSQTGWDEFLVSAETGEILLQETDETNTVICTGDDKDGNSHAFTAEHENNTYYLRNDEVGVSVYDAEGETFNQVWGLEDSYGYIYTVSETDSSHKAAKGLDERGNEVSFKPQTDHTYTVYNTAGSEVGNDAELTLLFGRYNAPGEPLGRIKIASSVNEEWKNPDAVSVYIGIRSAYGLCGRVLGIKGFDDQGGNIYGIYNEKSKNFIFEDSSNAYSRTLIGNGSSGDNKTILVFGKDNSLNTHTIGHEFGHSIIKTFADLEYKGESGAISEGIADVYGELIEDYYDETLDGRNDWIHDGRNLIEPESSDQDGNPCPAEYNGTNWCNTQDGYDKGGVHINSTVISHAAYLMSIGSKQRNCTPLNNSDIAKLYFHTIRDNDLPTNLGMIEFSEKMINTARMLTSQSALNWDKVTTVVQSLADVGLSDSCVLQSSLKSDFKIEVLDPNGTVYDDYHVEILSCSESPIFHSDFDLKRTRNSGAYSLHDEFDVKTHEIPSVSLPAGSYIIRITDNQSKTEIQTFSVLVSETNDAAEKLCAKTAMSSLDQPVDQANDQADDQPDDLTDFAYAEYYPVNMADITTGLDKFLNRWAMATAYGEFGEKVTGSKEYDVFDGRETWILPHIVYCNDFSEYPVTVQPRLPNNYYGHLEEEDMKWILTNIYNFSSDAISRLKQDADPNIYHDGIYELPIGAGAAPSAFNIQPAFNGKYYYVSYDIEWYYPGETEPFIEDRRHYALLEYKIIDGKGYWSIYKDTVDSNALAALGIN